MPIAIDPLPLPPSPFTRLARQGIAYDRNGRALALIDGSTLLVHDGESGAPLWSESFDEDLLGVAIAGDELVVVGELGLVVRLTLLRRELSRTDLNLPCEAFAVSRDGRIAVAHERSVSIVAQDGVHRLERVHVSALGFSEVGSTLLLARGETKSKLEWLHAHTFESLGEVALSERVSTIVAREDAFYIAHGSALDRMSTQPGERVSLLANAGMPITDVAFGMGRNAPFAIQCERSIVDVYDALSSKRTMRLQYPMRVTRGIAFGPKPWLAIALSGGDANRIHLDAREVRRTTTHPGRDHAKWIVSVDEGDGAPRLEGDGPRGLKGQAPRPAPTKEQTKALMEAEKELREQRKRFDFWGLGMDPDLRGLILAGIAFVLYALFRFVTRHH